MARLVNEFDACLTTEVGPQKTDHHEVQRSFRVAFFKDVASFVTVMEDLGNPFVEESEDLHGFWTPRKLLDQQQLEVYVR